MWPRRKAVFADCRIARTSLPSTRALAVVGIENGGDHRDQRRLAAAARADQHHQLAAADIEVDAAQRHHPRGTGAERAGDAAQPHRQFVAAGCVTSVRGGHRVSHALNTTAGSSRITLRTLSSAVIVQTSRIITSVISGICQSSRKRKFAPTKVLNTATPPTPSP